jgi:hypothetical protein
MTLYHGSKAFRVINERLRDGSKIPDEVTITSVALLVNKEVSKYSMKTDGRELLSHYGKRI